jgi:hypothetical protein
MSAVVFRCDLYVSEKHTASIFRSSHTSLHGITPTLYPFLSEGKLFVTQCKVLVLGDGPYPVSIWNKRREQMREKLSEKHVTWVAMLLKRHVDL